MKLREFESPERICAYCLDYLKPYLKEHVYNNLIDDKRLGEDFVKNLFVRIREVYYPYSELEWLRKDERACYFVWLYLLEYHIDMEMDMMAAHVYNREATNIDGRFYAILTYLDNPHISPNRDKKQILKDVASAWGGFMNEDDPFFWLEPDDSELCAWVWEYLKKQNIPTLRNAFYVIRPVNHREMYLAIYGVFYNWPITRDERKAFLKKLGKARSMRKQRKKTD